MSKLLTAHTRKHLPALDSVRGLAILGVFCFHLLAASWGGGSEHLKWGSLFRNFQESPSHLLWFYPFTFGWIGVSLFFVLSGFVIHYSFVTAESPGLKAFSVWSFYARRFWRIYPPYAAAVILFFLLPASRPPPDVRALSLVTHALLVQDFSNRTFALINPSFWSIATEVQFYLVYPLLLVCRSRLGMSKVLIGVLCLSLITRLLICAAKRHDPAVFDDGHLMLWTMPMITLFDWTLGAFIAERFAHGRRVFSDKGIVLAGTAILFFASTLIRPLSIFSFQFGSLLAAVWLERVVWSERPLRTIEKALIPLGLCSYSFYLFHQPLLEIMVGQFKQITGAGPSATALIAGPMIFLILLTLSWLIYLGIERPSMQLGKRLSRLSPRGHRLASASSSVTDPVEKPPGGMTALDPSALAELSIPGKTV